MRITPSRMLVGATAFAVAVVLSGVAASVAPGASPAPIARSASTATTVLANDVVPNLGTYTDLGAVAPGKQMQAVVVLKHDDAAIAAFESSLANPASPNYQSWLTPDQFQARFGAPAASVATVRGYATRYGLQLYNAGGLGDLTLVSGTAAQVEQTFGVSIHNYLDATGREFYANVNAPTVPANVGVVGVLGLQNLIQMKRPPGIQNGQGQCAGGRLHRHPRPERAVVGLRPAGIGPRPGREHRHHRRGPDGRRDQGAAPLRGHAQPPERAGAGLLDRSRPEDGRRRPRRVGARHAGLDRHGAVRVAGAALLRLGPLRRDARDDAPDVGERPVRAAPGQRVARALRGQPGARRPARPGADGQRVRARAGRQRRTRVLRLDRRHRRRLRHRRHRRQRRHLRPRAERVVPGCRPECDRRRRHGRVHGRRRREPEAGRRARLGPHRRQRSNFIAQPAYQQGITALQASYCASQPNGTPYSPPALCRGTSDVSALSGDGTIILAHRADGTFQANGYDMVDLDDSSGSDVYADHFAEGGTSLSSPLWTGMWARVNAAHKRGAARPRRTTRSTRSTAASRARRRSTTSPRARTRCRRPPAGTSRPGSARPT